MQADVEIAARENLSRALEADVAPDDIDLDVDMVEEYGLTSLNKVLFLTSVCDDTGVELSNFTEHDLARMRTLRDVIASLAEHAETAA
jgi:acyl carrier protein